MLCSFFGGWAPYVDSLQEESFSVEVRLQHAQLLLSTFEGYPEF